MAKSKAKPAPKKAAPKKAVPAKKSAKPAAKKAAPKKAVPAKKAAKPAPKKAVAKPAPKKAPAKSSTALKVVKTIGKLLKGKKEDPKKIKEQQKKAKALEMKAKKDAAKKAKDEALKSKSKEKEAKKAAKEQAILDKKQAKVQAKEDKKLAKEAAKNGGKVAAAATEEKPRRGRSEEALDLFGDDDFTEGEDIGDIEDFDFEEEAAPKSRKGSLVELDSLETRISEEITNLAEHFDWNEIHEAVCSLEYFVDNKSDECMEKACDNLRTTQGYCRLHYIKNYKTVKRKKEILREGKLQDYITELITKYPPKFIEQMLADLTDDREFYKVLNDLGITTNYNYDDVEESVAAVEADDDDDLMVETRTIVTARLGYDDEEM